MKKIIGFLVLTICVVNTFPRNVLPVLGQLENNLGNNVFMPVIFNSPGNDWPQIGNNAQRTNYTPEQVNPPYCYAWKWYEVPIASRAQPVVADGILVIGSMNGVLYARNAYTGAPLWQFSSQGPIRHSPGILNRTVVFSSHDGFTYALNLFSGSLIWKSNTGSSATAPLMDKSRNWVIVASTNGSLTALRLTDGLRQWRYNSGAPILTTPSMSLDYRTIFIGNEAMYAIAINASTGTEIWRTKLRGQSLGDRYPVVAGNNVIYRSQPIYNFHLLLHEGDEVMDQAGPRLSDWNSDWVNVKGKILYYLNSQPSKQTFFVLDATNGQLKGTVPVLYTYGNNDVPAPPVVSPEQIFLPYRARHGIQTDSNTVHVTTRYDAELGSLDISTLDITGLRSNKALSGQPEFRMTSDEPSTLTMGGSILWVDNWERAGGLDIKTGDLIHIGSVSNVWPECSGECSPGGNNPFFPLYSGQPAYPFPSPRVTDGVQTAGIVISNGMLYWRVIEGGLAGIIHKDRSTCPVPKVWSSPLSNTPQFQPPQTRTTNTTRSLSEYVNLDLTNPVSNPNPDLVEQVREQVSAIVDANNHLMPFFLERGFTNSSLWPYDTTNPPGIPAVYYINTGNVFWHDPGELLYTMAMAYPYLDASLQTKVKSYMASEMKRYPPLSPLPWSESMTWLKQGIARESYEVPFRSSLHNWPPPAPNFSVLYGLWLWSKNTGDWSYTQSHWTDIKNLYNAHKNTILYYADIAGAIGFARIANQLGYTADYQNGIQTALAGLQSGLNFDSFRIRAENNYPDPWGNPTGWYAPAFFGLVPEIGLYLREQMGSKAENYLLSKETGDGLRWWYITRVGMHAESGETSFILPTAAWSHFLAHAYIIGNSQKELISWLDRPWGRGDLYAIQKIVAAIHAKP